MVISKNVQKRKPRPKRSIKEPDEDHPLGLWIDKDLLRKHYGAPRTIIHDPLISTNQRYLELADLVLGMNKPNGKQNKEKKKAKAAAAE